MTSEEAITIVRGVRNSFQEDCFDEIEALDLAIKALHTVEIINEELGPAYEETAIWFDVPHFEEIQERAEMRVKNELRGTYNE